MTLVARVFDAVAGSPLSGWTDPVVNTADIRPDGKAIACARQDGRVTVHPIDPVGNPTT